MSGGPELLAALKELLASQLTTMPPFEAGKDAQNAWADQRAKARNDAAVVIAKAEGLMSDMQRSHTISTTDAAPAVADICAQIEQIQTRAMDLINRIADQRDAFRTALQRMVTAHLETQSDSEGRYPAADSGCDECTCGTVPARFHKGPCAYHAACDLLAKFPARRA